MAYKKDDYFLKQYPEQILNYKKRLKFKYTSISTSITYAYLLIGSNRRN